mgnify:CR=1 FL=1
MYAALAFLKLPQRSELTVAQNFFYTFPNEI